MIGLKMVNLKSNINDYLNDKVRDPTLLKQSSSVQELNLPIKMKKLKVDESG